MCRALILVGLTPGLLCELVLKDEFTFQIPALEIFPKTWGGGGQSYIISQLKKRTRNMSGIDFARSDSRFAL